MGEVYDSIAPEMADFIAAQHVFFVATAPCDGGHVNLSPKGLDSFRVLDPNTVAWLDLTGSGAETIAHLRENGRITVMFCAFGGKPRIVRLYGTGTALPLGTPAADELAAQFPELAGSRSVIRVAVDRVSTSCGYGVPIMSFERDRSTLPDLWAKAGPDAAQEYRAEKNVESIDGLPALP